MRDLESLLSGTKNFIRYKSVDGKQIVGYHVKSDTVRENIVLRFWEFENCFNY